MGFSGRESDGGGSGGPRDGRTGWSKVMAAVQATCVKIPSSAYSSGSSSQSSSSGALYDCQGKAGALRAR